MLHNDDVNRVAIPKYEELSVANLLEAMKNNETFMRYFPSQMPKGRQIDRTFFFNVFNTLHPEVLAQYLDHARAQRFTAVSEEQKKETIEITPVWLELLNKIPFKSSKSTFYS